MLIPRLLLLLSLLLGSGVTSASEAMTFQLRDGSVISGSIAGYHNGALVIDSKTLGQIQLKQSDIVTMTGAAPPSTPTQTQPPRHSNSTFTGAISAVQSQISANPALIQEIQALSTDAEIAALISDPTLLSLLMSGDLAAMERDPRIIRLMANPKIGAIIQQLSATMQ
ncbi:MAG: hypothetical protein HQL48_02095 [Gammaproteobacteria bacterium]|nr:hypothetical protein [Gammaproteobacteria bacterium]